ncbi:MAG TPA: hypothetical protein VJR27_05980 [Candidatus Saccharimonadales bacterium]|nr:hypothetical protein [Candidatus Saccharimonadales bacterium]
MLRKRTRLKREARRRNERSVAAIAARLAQERKLAEQQPARWPRADPDRGAIHDNRPTLALPQVGRHARPDDDTVPLVRPMTDSTFLHSHPYTRKARP